MVIGLGFIPSVESSDVTCVDTSPEGRWCDKGDGTVLDLTTNLVWLKDANCYGKISRDSAEAKPLTLNSGECGLTDYSPEGDWYLSTRFELQSLVSGDERILSSTPGFFDNVRGDWYWTSTRQPNAVCPDQSQYVVRLTDGILGNAVWCSSYRAYYAWPVRENKDYFLPVEIDIKPGSDPNCFNINGHGVIPVAILGSDDLEVYDIDPGTLLFSGLEVRMRGNKGPLCHVEDTNNDSFMDLVCQFDDDAENWSTGNAQATITGNLFDGSPIEGTDSICVVPPE